MKKILLAFQFLTIIPVKELKGVSEKEMGSVSALFPLIGFVQGLLYVASAALFLKVFPAELANGLLIFVIVLTNGGLHLDGLADTFDAVASRGDITKKLSIMKDSAVGPMGITAIVLIILLKYLCLNALFFNSSLITYYLLLIIMPVFSRWAMVPTIYHGKSARQEGLGRIFIENTGLKELATSTLLILLISLFVLFVVNKTIDSRFQFPLLSSQFLPVLPVLYIFSLIAVWFSNKKFGGMTGDTLGAVSEVSEILFLLSVLILR